ncbi:MAG: matrixin family metalloprotease, partial [Thermodesulfobacteriota bacterium]
WSQAGIKFEIKYIGRIVLPSNILKELTNGNYNPFLTGVDREFQISNPSLLNAFYTSSIGQVNGIAARSNMFFVTDFPSVRHERVTAHEIGHLLGLGHAHRDTARLMYSGTNGTILTKEEIKTARNNAKHKLNTTYHQD